MSISHSVNQSVFCLSVWQPVKLNFLITCQRFITDGTVPLISSQLLHWYTLTTLTVQLQPLVNVIELRVCNHLIKYHSHLNRINLIYTVKFLYLQCNGEHVYNIIFLAMWRWTRSAPRSTVGCVPCIATLTAESYSLVHASNQICTRSVLCLE